MKDEQVIETTNSEGKKIRIIRRIVKKSEYSDASSNERQSAVEKNSLGMMNNRHSISKSVIENKTSGLTSISDTTKKIATSNRVSYENNKPDENKALVGTEIAVQVMLKKIIGVCSNMMFVVNNDVIFMINSIGAKVLGAGNPDAYCGKIFSDLITLKDKQLFKRIGAFIDEKRDLVTKIIRDNGSELDCVIRANYFKVDDNKSYVIEIKPFSDLMKIKEMEALNNSILYDNLTGMTNDLLFKDRLRHKIEKDANSSYQRPVYPVKLCVMAIDVSGLYNIKDIYGIDVANYALKYLTDRINTNFKRVDASCRNDFDTIFLLFEDIEDIENAELVGKRVVELLNEPIPYETEKLQVNSYIGISVYPLHHLKYTDLIESAKKTAKSIKGTNTFCKVCDGAA